MTNVNFIKYVVIVVTLFVLAAVYYYKSSKTNSNTTHSSGNSHTSNIEHPVPTNSQPTPRSDSNTGHLATTEPTVQATAAPTRAVSTTAPTASATPTSPATAAPTMAVSTTAPTASATPTSPATAAPTRAVSTTAPTNAPATTATSEPKSGNFLATTAPTAQTSAPATTAPTAAGPKWGPYGAFNFTSATEYSFVPDMCDGNGVQFRTQIDTPNPLTEYGDCDNGSVYRPDFSGTWDKCILNGIDCGQVTIKSNGGFLFEIVISPLPVSFKRNPVITYSTKSTTISCGAFNANLGQVTIYYDRTTGDRLVIRMGTPGSLYYLCRNVKPNNPGYVTLSGNVFNNYSRTTFKNKTLNVVSNGCL